MECGLKGAGRTFLFPSEGECRHRHSQDQNTGQHTDIKQVTAPGIADPQAAQQVNHVGQRQECRDFLNGFGQKLARETCTGEE